MKLHFRFSILSLLFFLASLIGYAQSSDRELLHQVASENKDAVNAIALYPTDTRKIIFEVAEYPEVIVKLYVMQSSSQSAFEKLVSQLSQEEQDRIWNMTRYDGLIADLSLSDNQTDADLNAILANYPEEIRIPAKQEVTFNRNLLKQINQLNIQYNTDFEDLLKTYPPAASYAFREIIKIPAVLKLLYDHMQYTVVIGEYYKKNPDRVIHKTDSLYQVLSKRNMQESNDWAQSIQNDSVAQQQFQQATQEYAQYNGYSPDQIAITQNQLDDPTPSFTWWFGYPSWFPDNYWTPNPYWSECGCYWNNSGQMEYFSTPSNNFMQWYFYYPDHFARYPQLANNFYSYYLNHPNSIKNNAISLTVDRWKSSNNAIVNDAWDKDPNNRTERFQQLGLLESPAYNQGGTPAAYLQAHPEKFSLLTVNNTSLNEHGSSPTFQAPIRFPSIKNTPANRNVNNAQNVIPQHHASDQYVPKTPVRETYQNHTATNGSNSVSANSNNYSTATNATNSGKQTTGNATHSNPIPTYHVTQTNYNDQRAAQQYHQNNWQQPQENHPPVSQPATSGSSSGRRK